MPECQEKKALDDFGNFSWLIKQFSSNQLVYLQSKQFYHYKNDCWCSISLVETLFLSFFFFFFRREYVQTVKCCFLLSKRKVQQPSSFIPADWPYAARCGGGNGQRCSTLPAKTPVTFSPSLTSPTKYLSTVQNARTKVFFCFCVFLNPCYTFIPVTICVVRMLSN